MKTVPAQRALAFPVRRACTFDTFEGADAELLVRLQRCAAPARFSVVWIVGPPGTGKSHLLQAVCSAVANRGGAAAYLPADLREAADVAIDGLDGFDLVAVDDLEAWLGDRRVEAALLALHHDLERRAATLLVASACAPAAAAFTLADLASRLRAAEVFGLAPLDDAACARLLARAVRDKGLALTPDVAAYLLRRAPRVPGALVDLVDRLDTASLVAQRRLTVPLVRDVLDLQSPA